MSRKLWLAVTPDKFELPLMVENTAKELAAKLGIKEATVISQAHMQRSGRNKGRKIIKVELEKESRI